MSTPDKINAAQKTKVEKKYPGSTKSTDIYIGGSSTPKPKTKVRRGPRLPVGVREVRDKMI